MSERLRVGIVGPRGLAYASGFRALPGVELVALCDINADVVREQAARHEIGQTFTRLENMLNAVDAIVLATPMHLHVPQAIVALNAGKHVLSEVTAAVTLEECWRLLDAVQASGKTYMMAENYCYQRDNVLVRELVRNGLFGDVYFGEGEYLHEVRSYHHSPDGDPTWRAFWQVGQRGCTYGTHSLGPVMQWFAARDPNERVARVSCFGSGIHTAPEHPHDDTCLMLCQLQSGKLVKVRLDMLSNRPNQATYYALQGTTGVYEASRVEGAPGQVWFGENKPGEHRQWRPLSDFADRLPDFWRDPPPEARQAGHGGGDFFVVRDFVEAVQAQSPPPIDIFTSLEWTAAGLCSQISIENGGVPIVVPNFRDPAARPLAFSENLP